MHELPTHILTILIRLLDSVFLIPQCIFYLCTNYTVLQKKLKTPHQTPVPRHDQEFHKQGLTIMTERCKPDLNDPAQLPKQHLNPKHLLKHIGTPTKVSNG